MVDWKKGAAKAIRNFRERKRVYPGEFSLLLVDYLVERGVVSIEELYKFLTPDFIETTLGHVTTPVHGPGSVPEIEGWYSRDDVASVYRVNPAFAEAWKAERGPSGGQ
jgi:hypothetical protein